MKGNSTFVLKREAPNISAGEAEARDEVGNEDCYPGRNAATLAQLRCRMQGTSYYLDIP